MEEFEESLKNIRTLHRAGSSGANGVSMEAPSSNNSEAQIDPHQNDQSPVRSLPAGIGHSAQAAMLDKEQREIVEKTTASACGYFVLSLIDDICLHEAKREAVLSKHKKNEGKFSESELESRIKADLEMIPERSCPPMSQSFDLRYKHKIPTKVRNEKGNPAGEFGWCIVCRKPAERYCRDLRVPVCNHDCKLKHLQENGTWLFLCFP